MIKVRNLMMAEQGDQNGRAIEGSGESYAADERA